MSEIQTDCMNRTNKDLHRGLNEFKKDFRLNSLEDGKSSLLDEFHNILNRCIVYLNQVLSILKCCLGRLSC
jgi:hypothetical protein